MKTYPILAAIVAAFAQFPPVESTHAADVVNYQFVKEGDPNSQPYTGRGAAPDDGTYWNQVTFTSVSNEDIACTLPGLILKSDGKTRSAVILAEFKPGGESEGCVGIFADNTEPEQTKALVNTFLLVKADGMITVTIGGLTPRTPYDLYLYGQNSKNYSDVAKFTVPATSTSVTVDNRGATRDSFSFQLANTAPGNGGNYGILASVPADESGKIVIEVTQADFEGAFNGIQIVSTTPTTKKRAGNLF
ncbi:MAG: hypothetical protein WC003_14210 [Terrimicrobiaceae bacterium]